MSGVKIAYNRRSKGDRCGGEGQEQLDQGVYVEWRRISFLHVNHKIV